MHWVFVAARGLSLVAVSRGYSLLWCTGFLLQWLLLLRSTGSRRAGFSSCGSRALERRLSSCGAWSYLLRGMWDLPEPGIEPVSPALAGRFLNTAPPGKPYVIQISILIVTFVLLPPPPIMSQVLVSPLSLYTEITGPLEVFIINEFLSRWPDLWELIAYYSFFTENFYLTSVVLMS